MTLATSTLRAVSALSAGLLTLGILAACTPAPEPKPTKTALFASDEEAFKAAEETYRSYNDAGNSHRRGGTEDPQDYLIGSALEGYIDGQRYLKESGLSLEGDIRVASFVGDASSFEPEGKQIKATVCLDISQTTTHSTSGTELPERPPVLSQLVEMRWVDDSYRITGESEGDATSCAD